MAAAEAAAQDSEEQVVYFPGFPSLATRDSGLGPKKFIL